MTDIFVSYAQNYEDVYLWRALKHVERGCYVDVGAWDPNIDSVTRAFYERGWRGVNIEPTEEHFHRLCQARPEDINLSIAAGSAEGVITLYEVRGTGLSTPVYDNALRLEEQGLSFDARKVPVLTLNKIWQDLLLDTVHFLKIDVEGTEEAVLLGLNLSKYRPWIIVIESTIPNSPEENFASWEPILLGENYHFAVFDGLNRYYVAKEHRDLCVRLAKPPNFFDYFVRAAEVEARQEAVTLRQSEHALRDCLERTESKREVLEREVDGLHGRIAEVQRANKVLRGALDEVFNSRSMRYTAPLRAAKHWIDPPLRALQNLDWRVAQAPLHAVRRVGLWAANRPMLRRPAKRLLARWPGLRWRMWRFLLTTPKAAVGDQIGAMSLHIRNTLKTREDKEQFKMFAMSEPRQPLDVEALKARISRERERQRAGGIGTDKAAI